MLFYGVTQYRNALLLKATFPNTGEYENEYTLSWQSFGVITIREI